MLSKVYTALAFGLDVYKIEVEVDVSRGNLPRFNIVGLPDASVKEAKERVRSAVRNSGINIPWQRVILINLAPADIKKEGPVFDLPMAIGVLKSSVYPDLNTDDSIFIGELSLDGRLRYINGVLPCAIFAKQNGYNNIYVPSANAKEAALVDGLNVYPVSKLTEIVNHLTGKSLIEPFDRDSVSYNLDDDFVGDVDMAYIKGQDSAKRALEIAAAGGHNVLLSGPPGSGKTLLARTFVTILPKMTKEEVLEVTKIYSIAGMLPKDKPLIIKRPFRSPHHTSSGTALVGGGRIPRPGEVSLAHRGVLFLDELPEFSRSVLENLRQPIEDGFVTISRAQANLTFPASFTLIAAQNPCPCGFNTDTEKECKCTPYEVKKYQSRVSGPILDRIDLQVEVPRLKVNKITGESSGEPSRSMLDRIEKARDIQRKRFAGLNIMLNSRMSVKQIKKFCRLPQEGENLLNSAVDKLSLSPRTYFKIIRTARTIADLRGDYDIKTEDVLEAVQYRFRRSEE